MSTRPKTAKSPSSSDSERLILLTGVSGYVGSRLLRALEAAGHRVRCAGRRPEAIATSASKTTVVRTDVLDRESIGAAMHGVDTAYYLVHSMNAERSFESADRDGARNFAEAARAAGVRRNHLSRWPRKLERFALAPSAQPTRSRRIVACFRYAGG